jgi:cytochrome c biogenesis protein CcmG, thiol:disulfide interchange protein DsbE
MSYTGTKIVLASCAGVRERVGLYRVRAGSARRGPLGTLIAWWPALVAVLGVIVAAYLVLRPAPAGSGMVGKAAPDFTLRTPSGAQMQLQALRGRPVLVNFWGVSCPPCRHEVSLLQAVWTADKNHGLVILGVDEQRDDAASVSAFASERGVTYPMVLDATQKVAPDYGIKDLPQSILVDAQGIVREVVPSPFLDRKSLDLAISLILP